MDILPSGKMDTRIDDVLFAIGALSFQGPIRSTQANEGRKACEKIQEKKTRNRLEKALVLVWFWGLLGKKATVSLRLCPVSVQPPKNLNR